MASSPTMTAASRTASAACTDCSDGPTRFCFRSIASAIRAQDVVKQLCRRWQKPYVPVRRSGLGAYRAALETVATTAPDQEIAP